MPRRIVDVAYQAAAAAGAPSPRLDGYFDRVIKYIPGDVVSAWVLVNSLIEAGPADVNKVVVGWIAFGVGVIVTALWMLTQTGERGQPPAYRQTTLATIAFVVWVMALGFPFTTIPHYHQLYGSLLLVLYTLLTFQK